MALVSAQRDATTGIKLIQSSLAPGEKRLAPIRTQKFLRATIFTRLKYVHLSILR